MRSKSGQVTIFIIVALLIVGGFVLYFFVADSSSSVRIPTSFQPAYTSFLTCLEDDVSTGINLLQARAGYIYTPDFEPGSQYMPFSSQLDFLGNPVPYWYYVSGNNVPREQVPSKRDMEQQLEAFVNDKIVDCNLNSYYDSGFEISWANPATRIEINNNNVVVNMEVNLNFKQGNESVLVRSHKIAVGSNLGSLYESAVKVYEESRENMLLENYAVDTLRLYAPVDGVEISCSPLIWNADEVLGNLKEGIEANTLAMNSKVSTDDYFIVDLPVREEVRFINSKDWPYSFEVTPAEGSLLMANPVGNQPGLGALGFCYAPYHFIYDVSYPVLVQVHSSSGQELFQFPMAVVIENNNPRESLEGDAVGGVDPELCQYKDAEVILRVVDKTGRPVNADVSYECSDNSCYIGKADPGTLKYNLPRCVNGFVTARAEGFRDASYLFSSVSDDNLLLTMDKLYGKEIQLKLGGVNYNGEAILYFTSGDYSQTIVYPNERVVDLSEGQYEVQAQIYKNSSITLGESVQEQCVEVPRSGFLGLAGLRKERCFEVEIPEQVISQVLVGGGEQNHYLLESELSVSNILEINVEEFPLPESVEQLNVNYLLFDNSGMEINFI
ncbi:MAG: hypothetical protein Q8P81_04080 [Nanoarchaeota archaeon]|nr:hypothetical protein [Nanoarchaeota archaeon]